jgi:hypothetical protein
LQGCACSKVIAIAIRPGFPQYRSCSAEDKVGEISPTIILRRECSFHEFLFQYVVGYSNIEFRVAVLGRLEDLEQSVLIQHVDAVFKNVSGCLLNWTQNRSLEKLIVMLQKSQHTNRNDFRLQLAITVDFQLSNDLFPVTLEQYTGR